MLVEVCPSNLTTCRTCEQKILSKTLRVTIKGYYCAPKYYHLACYKHYVNSPILFSSVSLHKVSSESDIEEVKQWVEMWNEQFIVTPEKVPAQFLTKSVATVSTSFRRLFLEVFKFLTLSIVETGVALVCKEWFHVSRDEELWKTRIVLEFSTAETQENASNRTQYITLRLSACWHCKKIPSLENIWMVCPYYKRPICTQCHSMPLCRLVTLATFLKSRLIKKSTSDMLAIPQFKYNRANSTYVILALEKIIPYAKHRKELLLARLENDYASEVLPQQLEMMRDFDLESFYEKQLRFPNRYIVEMLVFCGKNERPEKLEKNVAKFIKKVKITLAVTNFSWCIE